MSVLALDLGTKTGHAWWAAGGAVVSGTIDFKSGRYEGGGMRYLRFAEWLDRLHKPVGLKRVYFEEVRRHLGTDAAHVYGGLLASLTAWCERNGVAYQGVPVGTIKKYWTGKGNAPKEAMIDMARQHGFEPEDDNEADAIALLYYAVGEMMDGAVDELVPDAKAGTETPAA